jgi:uncharacterized membrane protein
LSQFTTSIQLASGGKCSRLRTRPLRGGARVRNAGGEIYSLFPATSTDIYGRKFATTNYGLLYTAKGTASLLVPLANVLQVATGSWKVVFLVAAALNIVAAVMALVVLKPMRTKTMSRNLHFTPN